MTFNFRKYLHLYKLIHVYQGTFWKKYCIEEQMRWPETKIVCPKMMPGKRNMKGVEAD